LNGASVVAARQGDALARILPFALYIGFLAAMPLFERLFPNADSRWLYAAQIGAVLTALVFFARGYGELTGKAATGGARMTASQWGMALAVGGAVFALWIHLDLPWLRLGGEADGGGFDPRDAAGAIDWPLAAVRLFGAAVVVPVMEELFWRSFLMRWLRGTPFESIDPRTVGLRAIVLSTFVFALAHTLWLAAVVAGLAYAALYVVSGRLWLPVIAHAVTNALLAVWVVATGQWQFW
jgi:CAAX prenyl protease-like protein